MPNKRKIENNTKTIGSNENPTTSKLALIAQADGNLNATVLDKMIGDLSNRVNHSEIILLITPSRKQKNRYTMHLINRVLITYLGGAHISKEQLVELKTNETYQDYCIAVGSKPMEKNLAIQREIIKEVVNSLNMAGNCKYRCKSPKSSKEENQCQCRKEALYQPEQFLQEIKPDESQQPQTPPNMQEEHRKLTADQADSNESTRALIASVVDRINNAPQLIVEDLNEFFSHVEKNKLKIFVRPELRGKSAIAKELPIFHVDCFMEPSRYVGSIRLDEAHLMDQLHGHPRILRRTQVVTDVLELTPISKILCTVLRKMSSWFGLELMYDTFAEYMFNRSKTKGS